MNADTYTYDCEDFLICKMMCTHDDVGTCVKCTHIYIYSSHSFRLHIQSSSSTTRPSLRRTTTARTDDGLTT